MYPVENANIQRVSLMNSRRGHKTPRRKKTSMQTNTDNHIPRFEFGINIDHEGDRTATIKDLLVELHSEINFYPDGKPKGNELLEIDKKSLNTVLSFLSKISGRSLKSITERHPENDIKTIKTLFIQSRNINSYLFNWIKPPNNYSESIIDILNSEPTEKNIILFRKIEKISNELSKEISEKELKSAEEIKNPIVDMDAYLLDATKIVDDIILRHFYADEKLTMESDEFLAKETIKYIDSLCPIKSRIGMHSATYTYLKNIKYIHWLYFLIDVQLTIPDDKWIGNKQIDFDKLCQKIRTITGITINKDTNFMSPDDAPAFIDSFSEDIAILVSKSTELDYRTSDVFKDKKRAMTVLKLYLEFQKLPNDYNATPIGIAHVVSAFCSIRQQRKSKIRIGLESKEYSAELKSPQNILDSFELKSINKIPYTIKYIYRERMLWYLYALTGRKEKYDSYTKFLILQLKLYKEIYMSLDSELIKAKIMDYKRYIANAADDFVTLHGRKDFILDWKSGGIRQDHYESINRIITN